MFRNIFSATVKESMVNQWRGRLLFSKCEGVHPSKKDLREQKREKLQKFARTGQKIVIDFAHPNIMNDKDCHFLVQQTKLLYDSNLNAVYPFSLNFAGLTEGSFLYETFLKRFPNFDDIIVNFLQISISEAFPGKEIVYLTPDATRALESLDAGTVYVLGGMVDYQVRKNTTLKKAMELNIKTRRLPIPEFMDRKNDGKYTYSQILSINQVFAILLKYYETKDWRLALPVGVPKRRGFVPRFES